MNASEKENCVRRLLINHKSLDKVLQGIRYPFNK